MEVKFYMKEFLNLKIERFQIRNLAIQLKELEKQEQTTHKTGKK